MKELQCFRRDERKQVQNLGSLCSDRTRTLVSSLITCRKLLDSPKKVFLPNEPKPVQCLPGKLKKQQRAKRSKTDTKPLKTHLKQH
jgi:hypothetical protein